MLVDGISQSNRAHTILVDAVDKYAPVALFAMFSGGHDSLCSTHIAAQHPQFTAVVHINTGIGIERTREFVRDTCRDQGWPLIELRTPPAVYAEQVRTFGFPAGRQRHQVMFRLLKERQVERLIREHKHGRFDRIGLVAGARRQESTIRMSVAQDVHVRKAQVWINPIVDWSHADKNEYMEANHLPRNPVVDNLHMSGECLCGAFARMPDSGELDAISFFYPETGAYIRDLEKQVFEAGQWPNWGCFRPEDFDEQGGAQPWLPLCQDCPTRWAV